MRVNKFKHKIRERWRALIMELLTWLHRWRLRGAVADNVQSINETIATVRREKARAKENGSAVLDELYDVSLYLLMLNLDHAVLHHDLIAERNGFRKSVYSKHLILLFSEFFEDFPMLLGGKVRVLVKALPRAADHAIALDEISLGLRAYRKKHEKDFHRIRNIVAAHRDLDGQLQLEALESIDHQAVEQLAFDFMTWLNQVWKFLKDAVSDYSNSPQMLRDVCKKAEPTGSGRKR